MKVTILGGGGFIGRKLAARLANDGTLGGKAITSLTLLDLKEPLTPTAPFPVAAITGDLIEMSEEAIPADTEVVFHLAAVVAAQAETDYEAGRRVNIRGADAVVDACRKLVAAGGRPPRVVFTSTLASFSTGQGSVPTQQTRQIPGNSYGTQKAIVEMILADASRRGFLDAVCIRVPTVVIRPGRLTTASGFLSAIVREPLLGLEADLPVAKDFAAWVCSAPRLVDWLIHAATIDSSDMGLDRSVNPPGLSVKMSDLLDALEQVKPGASKLVKVAEHKGVSSIVNTWPKALDTTRAQALGFSKHEPVIEVIKAFIKNDLEPTRAERNLAPS